MAADDGRAPAGSAADDPRVGPAPRSHSCILTALLAALTVLVGVQILALSKMSFFIINVTLILLWIALALVVIREHRRMSELNG